MDIQIKSPRWVEDARGIVCEPITPSEMPAQNNAHVVLTRPGGVRGNHYHEHGTEIMTVIGPALVRVRDGEGVRDYRVEERQATRFTLPPRVAHAILNTGNATGVIVSFSTWAHDPARPDVVREVLIEPTAPD
jgi:UDP-2-acetamido-2,6-beta-L-arabino-hexul-4-ose reductase